MASPKTPPASALEDAALAQVVGGSADVEPPLLWDQNPDADLWIASLHDDMVAGDNKQQIIIAGGGHDHVLGGGGNDILLGNDGRDTLLGGDGDDTLAGGRGVDVVDGGYGDDVIIWSPGDGSDLLTGHMGTDELRLERTGLSIEQVLAGLVPDHGRPLPAVVNGALDLTGLTGSLTIRGETIRFSGFEKLTVSDANTLHVPPEIIP